MQCLPSIKAFFASHTASPESRLGVQKKLGGDTAGTADFSWPKGYPRPYHVVFSNKSWRKEEWRRGPFGVTAFAFPSNNCAWWNAAFLEMAEHSWLPVGSTELIPCFALCAHIAFPLPIKLSLSQLMFSHFCPSGFLPHCTVGEWESGYVGLSCWLGFIHSICQSLFFCFLYIYPTDFCFAYPFLCICLFVFVLCHLIQTTNKTYKTNLNLPFEDTVSYSKSRQRGRC